MLVFTLATAGVTVFVMLGLFAIPAIDACRADQRGLVDCIRGLIGSRFELPVAVGPPRPALAEGADDGPAPATGETPDEFPGKEHAGDGYAVEDEDAAPRLAELPADDRPPELARSLGPAPKSTLGVSLDLDVPNAAPRPVGAAENPAGAAADAVEGESGLAPPALPPVLAAALDAFDPALLGLPLAPGPDLPSDVAREDGSPAPAPDLSDMAAGTPDVLAVDPPGVVEAPALPDLSPPVPPPALAAALGAFDPRLLLPAMPAVPQPERVVDLPATAEAPEVEADAPVPETPAVAHGPVLLPDLSPPVLPPALAAALDSFDPQLLAPAPVSVPELSAAAGPPVEPEDPAPFPSAPVEAPGLPDVSPPATPPALAAVLDAVDPALFAPVAAMPVPDPVPDAAVASIAEADDATEVAATTEQPLPAALPDRPAVLALPPTIDAVELDGSAVFVAGDGPAGALMRLYVDGLLVGESPVEAGRWLVEGVDLLTLAQQMLRVEAVDPFSGEVLSSAAISFEIELPAAIEAPRPDTVAAPAASLIDPDHAVSPDDPPEAKEGAPDPASPVESVPAADVPALPPIRPVVPSAQSESVIILGAPEPGTILELAPAAPSIPAIVASFVLPSSGTSTPRLRAVPFGDPGAGRFVSGKAIIRRGDTLWDIAHRYYGRGVRFSVIYQANRDLIARPSRIYPGQVFDLPLVYDD